MSSTVETATEIRTFELEIPEEQIDDLRRRIAATRWPSKELVEDRSQGVQLATLQELAQYWVGDYDFGRLEARLNALPQFTTEIDGVEIHFIHVRSEHEDALPLIMTHGWPGSVIELLETIGPLTDPTAHGGTPGDAFHLVLPSLPGYGFSGEPAELGWDAARIARAWAELMDRLGYTRYVAQGGDVGAYVTDAMGRQAPEGLLGIHLNVLTAAVALQDKLPANSEQERAAHDALATFLTDGFAIVLEQSTRPQTIGYSLLDSPVGLAAWMLDHDTDSYYKISRAFVDGEPAGNLTRDNIIDDITLYWLTGTGASAARWYWEFGRAQAAAGAAGQAPAGRGSGRLHELPRRGLPCPAQLGRGGFPRPRLLQRARQGRPLRRLGGAAAPLRRGAGRIQVTEDERRLLMSSTVDTATEIKPFHVEIPQEQIDDLRRRIGATRWPSQELVQDRSQGVQLATLQELARYWATDYDWRKAEAKLNALPQFTTEIDGVEIHFIHVRSKHEDALPLVMTHGWPGSVIELLETVGPLTDPTAHGGDAEDAFDLVLPSIPGYGFSAEPTEVGWDPGRTGLAWAELMRRLGYTRYVAQGGDVGASITDAMGRQAPEGLLGIHMNLLVTALAGPQPAESEQERAAADALATFRATGFGYFLEQATRPQTIGYALLDSPVALAAWMLDHDTDSYYKISRAFVDGRPAGNLTRDHIVDNITLYWLTGTGASAARSYWESGRAQALAAGQAPPDVSIPVGFTTFPDEIFRAPRSWVEKGYPNLTYFNEADKGGHFAAWEEPELFSTEVRAAFRSLRS